MNEVFFKRVGENILQILKEKSYTQQFLANEIGVSKQVMNKITAGKKAINIEEASKIARVLGTTVDALLKQGNMNEKNTKRQNEINFIEGVKNPVTREKIETLREVIGEIVFLEEYGNGIR